MLRRIVMLLYGITKITPDRIMTYFIVLGSLVIVELILLLIRRVIICGLARRKGKTDG